MVSRLLVCLAALWFALPAHAQEPARAQVLVPRDSSAAALEIQQLFVRGLTQLRVDDPEDALLALTEALSLAPSNPALLAASADAYAALKDPESAFLFAQQAIEQAPDAEKPTYRLHRARLLARFDRTDEALAELEGLAAPDALDLRARLLAETGRTGEALTAYQTLRTREGDRPATLAALAELYAIRGDSSARAAVLADLVALNPAAASEETAAPQAEDVAPAAASAEDLQRELDANPREVALWRRTAAAYLAEASPERAAAIAEDGRLFFPGDPALPALAAEARLALDQPQRAEVQARAGLALAADGIAVTDAQRARLLQALGQALEAQGDPEGARAAYRQRDALGQ